INEYSTDAYKVAMGLVAFLKVHNPQILSDIIYKRYELKEILPKLSIKREHLEYISEVYLLDHLLQYHYKSDEELKNPENQNQFSDLQGYFGRRAPVLEMMFETVEGFNISY
ncbi:TPA: hypothetical protein ACM6VU_002723, partial [Escherichia coli]